MIHLTKREERLARAIEALSARDMWRLLHKIALPHQHYELQKKLLDYAELVKSVSAP